MIFKFQYLWGLVAVLYGNIIYKDSTLIPDIIYDATWGLWIYLLVIFWSLSSPQNFPLSCACRTVRACPTVFSQLSKPFLVSGSYIFTAIPPRTVKKNPLVYWFLFISFWQKYLPGNIERGIQSLTTSHLTVTCSVALSLCWDRLPHTQCATVVQYPSSGALLLFTISQYGHHIMDPSKISSLASQNPHALIISQKHVIEQTNSQHVKKIWGWH